MKKPVFFAALCCIVCLSFSACSKDDTESNQNQEAANGQTFDDPNAKYLEVVTIESLDYNAQYQESWNNYMQQVANLLYQDSKSLFENWNTMYQAEGKIYGMSFADIFKSHTGNGYNSNVDCVNEIIDGMIEIAGEVGDSKIGGPADKWAAGDKRGAVLAVESWYSWHSIDDYTNNIRSIRNVYYGKYFGENEEVTAQPNSMAEIMSKYSGAAHTAVAGAITDAINAIQSIPAPFRNYIAHPNVEVAREACARLGKVLETLKSKMNNHAEDHADEVDAMINCYVDQVVLPTYQDLYNKNIALLTAVTNFKQHPSNEGFTTLANAWMSSRRPWESSEAFLFGPVDILQLDPNMDYWPLDQGGIESNIKTGTFDNLNWSDGDDDDVIEAAQNLRGFHTLEYLIFKNGKARTIVELRVES